ncbi:MAG: transposase [Pirellulales bacterium]|nr:transposase [Pirellulales bacterium]
MCGRCIATLKYDPYFTILFGGHEDAMAFCRQWLPWYNKEHYHSGIGILHHRCYIMVTCMMSY